VASPDEIKREQIRREQIRREQAKRAPAGPVMAPVGSQQQQQPEQSGGPDPFSALLYKTPGVGQYIKQADEYLGEHLGQPKAPEISPVGALKTAYASGGVLADQIGRGFATDPEEIKRLEEYLGPGTSTALRLYESYVEPSPMNPLLKGAGHVVQAAGRGLEGGIDSGLSAYGHGASWPEVGKEALKGTGIAAGASAILGPVASWWNRRKNIKAQQFPTDESLTDARKAEYGKVDASGVVYPQSELARLRSELANMDLKPGTELDDMLIKHRDYLETNWANKDITPSKLDEIRQDLRGLGQSAPDVGSATKAKLGTETSKMIAGMDKFTKDAQPVYPSKTGMGPGAPAPKIDPTLVNARKLNAQEQKLAAVNKALADAKRQVTSGRFSPFSPSPESADVKEISKLEKKIAEGTAKSDYSPEEIALVEQLQKGTFWRNLGGRAEHMSFSGKLFWPAAIAAQAGHAAFNPLVSAASLAAPVVTGLGAEGLSAIGRVGTSRQIEDLKALLRDPKGKGIAVAPEILAEAKDRLAKMMVGAYRQSQGPYQGDR